MRKKTMLEIEYDKYLRRNDKHKQIGDLVFTRIVHKYKASIGEGAVFFSIPKEFFVDKRIDRVYEVIDENGKVFTLDSPVHILWGEFYPQWYRDTFTFALEEIEDVDEIGDYLFCINSYSHDV